MSKLHQTNDEIKDTDQQSCKDKSKSSKLFKHKSRLYELRNNIKKEVNKFKQKQTLDIVLQKPKNIEPFPEWLDKRHDFKQLKNSEGYNMNLKVVAICKIPSLSRDNLSRQMIVSVL